MNDVVTIAGEVVEPASPERAKPVGGGGRLFQPGNPGGPGRPRGSTARLKVTKLFHEAIHDTFSEIDQETGIQKGITALRVLRDTDPASYFRVLATIIPREITGMDGQPLISGITVTFVRPEVIEGTLDE